MKQTLSFKQTQCGKCKLADMKAIKGGRPGCQVFKDTGRYPAVENGQCLGRKPKGK